MSNKYSSKIIRASAILTNSYVASTVTGQIDNNDVQELNQLVLYIDFTKGSLTSLSIKLDFSDDGVNYYQETFESISGGTASASLGEHSYTATGAYVLATPFKAKFVKVSAKGVGTVTNSLCAIRSIVGIA